MQVTYISPRNIRPEHLRVFVVAVFCFPQALDAKESFAKLSVRARKIKQTRPLTRSEPPFFAGFAPLSLSLLLAHQVQAQNAQLCLEGRLISIMLEPSPGVPVSQQGHSGQSKAIESHRTQASARTERSPAPPPPPTAQPAH